ncbi:MAG: hypothetical protein IKI02_06300 [Oscillospiraceae bacterium]|nr:hypothetical protein [Oscillospiraceae bacterium]
MLDNLFRSALTLISPKLNANVVYWFKKKKRMNWSDPRSFPELLVKLRIEEYNHSGLVKRCADKYAVREYVEEKGFGALLNPLLAVYDRPEQIDWQSLPDRFALKLNSGCGCNLICANKNNFDTEQAVRTMKGWLKKKPWLGYAELQYKDVAPKFLAERFLEGKNGLFPEDYKLYCFHGKPQAVLYMQQRNTDQMRVGFFDTEWKYLGKPEKQYLTFTRENMPPAPASLSTMLRAAEALSAPFPFVRMDFYDLDGIAVFGEMTFSPAAGFDVSEIPVHGKTMAELLREGSLKIQE